MRIFVFAEKNTSLAELCSGARTLGDQVEVITIGSEIEQGLADKVWSIAAQNDVMFEDYTDTIAALVERETPDLLLVEPTKRDKLVAGRLAAKLGTSVITDVNEITPDLQTKRLVYGGAGVRKEKATTKTAIVMVGAGVFEAQPGTASGEVENVEFIEPSHKLKVVGTEQKPKVSADLTRAKRIIAVGRGIAKEEDMEMARNFASGIEAEIGCTRPVSEAGWLPRDLYIGVTGVMVAPEVFIALGISGQVQHTVGITQSKTVIAINKDKNAPIFKQADYGIVGDIYKVVPALVEHFSKVTV